MSDYGGDPDGLIVRQIALTEEQALGLPLERREEIKNSPADWPQPFKAEVEALDPDVLDGIVEEALAAVRDEEALRTAMAAEPEQRRRALRELADRLDDEEDDE